MILRFELAPGQNVSDFTLANQLGISRTPVREAINFLVRDGLILVTETGQVVSPIDEADLVDLCETREALETMIVRLIIEKKCLVPEDIAYMHSLNEDISKKNISNQIHLTFDPDEGFHNFIATKAGNRRIQEQFKILQLQMRRYRYLTLIDARRTELTVQEHERVIAALELSLIHIYASANATLVACLDRLFYSSHFDKTMKVVASVVCGRRGGCSATFDELNKYFTISGMPVASSQYWNSVHGRTPGEAEGDGEGRQTMRTLARNMAFLMKSIALGKEQFGLPEKEERISTSFIR